MILKEIPANVMQVATEGDDLALYQYLNDDGTLSEWGVLHNKPRNVIVEVLLQQALSRGYWKVIASD